MIVPLPWPVKRVFPNAKRAVNWRVYRKAEKEQRETGCILACAALPITARRAITAGDGHIPLKVTFYPPDNRNRDDDGMIGAFKHLRDGIADALQTDDRRFRASYAFEAAEKPGRIEVVFGQ